MKIHHDFSLKKLNTFGIDVRAKHLVKIRTSDELTKFIQSDQYQNDNVLVLGGGSNILFTKDFDGLVLKVEVEGIHVVREDDNYFWVKAGAGVVWQDLVESCIKANFAGLENLSLIPGTVGAAPIQNIGAYGVEIKDNCEAVEAIDLADGTKRYFTNGECAFGYRDSIFKNELRGKYLITNVVFRMAKNPILKINYGTVQSTLNETGKKEFSIRDVSDAIIKIRSSKLPDPEKVGNAGSFFKNPVIPQSLYTAIKKSYPNTPFYEQPNNMIKIPAAWMIDQCDLKGMKYNGAAVHHKQPLVLINQENATGADIVALSHKIQAEVRDRFGIQLEPEVRVI